MFAARLKWFTVLVALLAVGLLARLAEIQIVRADDFRRLAERMLTRPERLLPAPRGSILDREGRPLVQDVATSNVCVHFDVLAGNDAYFEALARELLRRGAAPQGATVIEVANQLRLDAEQMWQALARLSGRPRGELQQTAQAICTRIARMRAELAARRGRDQPLAEERQLHAVLEDVPEHVALEIRETLALRPWIRVVPSARRTAVDADALVHLLGKLGAPSAEQLADDPDRDDPLRSLRASEACGVSGVERLAEPLLRGTRGRIVEDFDRSELEHTPPLHGRDVYLTIDAELQRRTLEILGKAVEASPNPAGAAAVVLDAHTREVLVLASYPVYPFAPSAADFEALRGDARRLPLRFRAVSAAYPPGSTCKLATLAAGFAEGLADEHTRIHCNGYFHRPDAFRCWIYNEYPGVTHDLRGNPSGQNAEDAIRNSCNIYFYTIGDRLGPEKLCDWFGRFGLGRAQGTGLIEESGGTLPSADWLLVNRGRTFERADAWNFAIGQGELSATPLQCANVVASVVTGHWAPVRLLRGDPLSEPLRGVGPALRLDETTQRVLRSGMWRVTNEPGGTAYVARLDRKDFQLCGKTGSAQASPRVLSWRYTFELPDGRHESIVAASREEALAALAAPGARQVERVAAEVFPTSMPDDKLPSHAWFIGYTQPSGTPRGAAPRERALAISVLIEFGSSGGRNAGPVAKQIAEMILSYLEDGVG